MRCIKCLLFSFMFFLPAIGWADGVLTLPANPVSNVLSNGGVPIGGFLPPNYATGTFTSQGCIAQFAGGNIGNAAYSGTSLLIACDEQDTSGRFLWIWQNDTNAQPHNMFEVRRNGQTRANGFLVQPLDGGPPYYGIGTWKFRYQEDGTQWPMLGVTVDVPSTYVPAFAINGMPVNHYGGSAPPLASYWGSVTEYLITGTPQVSSFVGAKVYEVLDSGATLHQGLAAPATSCTGGGALAATTYYVRYTVTGTGWGESPPSAESVQACAINQFLVVTAPPLNVGNTWAVYVGNTNPGDETQQATGLTLASNWTQSGALAAGAAPPNSVTTSFLTITGGYAAPGSPTNAALVYIGGTATGGTGANYSLFVNNGAVHLPGIDFVQNNSGHATWGQNVITGQCGANCFEVYNSGATTTAQTLNIGNSSGPAPGILFMGQTAFASLGTPGNGTIKFCNDCDAPTLVDSTCTSSGAKVGSLAVRVNGAWKCIS